MHCGLCLDQCPTYRALGTEMDSPRGRIYQMVQVDEGRLALGESFVTHIDRCLGCLNCQTACPSGVPYGSLLERARSQIEENYHVHGCSTELRSHFYAEILPSFSKLSSHARSCYAFISALGLQSLARAMGLLKLLGVADLDALSPRIDSSFSFADLGQVFPAKASNVGEWHFLLAVSAVLRLRTESRYHSCSHAEWNRSSHSQEPRVVAEPCTCMLGTSSIARVQARRNIDAMLKPEFDAIVTNAAGCGSVMKEYASLLEHDAEYAERAKQFVAKVRDITEYLAQVGMVEPKRKLKARVTYQDPCHLAHAQGVRSAPACNC